MRQCSPSTADNIARLDSLPTKPTWLKLALSDVRNGKPMSLKRERRMCEALGIDPPPVMVETPACPDCGEPHVATVGCGGQPVTVRLVRPDGTSKRKRYWRPCLPHDMTADQKRRIMEIAEE